MNVTQETLDLLNMLKVSGLSPQQIAKAFTQATGLVWYDLEAPAKALYPYEELIPLVKVIPRVKGGGDTATRWKAITGININGTRPGVSEGNRGGIIATSVLNYSAAYKGLGLEDYATFEAGYAAVNFDDPRARAVQGVLRSLMISEEKLVIGGNCSLLVGTGGTPAGSAAASPVSTLTNQAYGIYVVPLTQEGFLYGPTSGLAGLVPANSALQPIITRQNADGSSDTFGGGVGQVSAQGTETPTATYSVFATTTLKSGAFAYAWYFGPSGSEVLHQITTINSAVFSAPAASGTQAVSALPASDNSEDGLVYDGILTQIFGSSFGQTSGSYVASQATGSPGVGTPLTSDGASGIVEIDTALKSFWDNYRLGPQRILVNSQEAQNINKKVVAGGGAPIFRLTMDGNATGVAQLTAVGGSMVGSYLNKFYGGGQLVEVRIHPFMPPGTIVFWSDKIPYALSDVTNIVQIKTRQEYYQIEWPLSTRKYEFGVYADEVFQNYFPPAFGALYNIANG